MGLDLVELTMEVAETFGIAIPDADAAGILTVGELHRYVVEKLRAGEATLTMSGCPSRAAFYRLRRALVEGLGADRRGIRPETPMGSLVAPRGRRASWDRLEQALGVRLPRLVRPKALVSTLTVFIMMAAVVIGLFGASVRRPARTCSPRSLPSVLRWPCSPRASPSRSRPRSRRPASRSGTPSAWSSSTLPRRPARVSIPTRSGSCCGRSSSNSWASIRTRLSRAPRSSGTSAPTEPCPQPAGRSGRPVASLRLARDTALDASPLAAVRSLADLAEGTVMS